MVILCISNSGRDLPESLLDSASGIEAGTVFPLEVGKEYVVLALTVERGYIWYYICDEDYSYYPVWSPAPLFNVVDGRLSSYWVYAYHREMGEQDYPIFAFAEWASEPFYYDRLTDGKEVELELFLKYRDLMEREASE